MNIAETLREIDHQRFLDDHIHLIVPLLFTSGERQRRDRVLLQSNWNKHVRT